MAHTENMHVVVRCRPLIPVESNAGQKQCVFFPGEAGEVHLQNPKGGKVRATHDQSAHLFDA